MVISGMTHPHEVSHEEALAEDKKGSPSHASCFQESRVPDSKEWMKVNSLKRGMSRDIREKRASIKHTESLTKCKAILKDRLLSPAFEEEVRISITTKLGLSSF